MNAADELRALVATVTTSALNDAGVCAIIDWLAEHHRERESALLRKRWKWWQNERTTAIATDQAEKLAAEAPWRHLASVVEAFGGTATVNVSVLDSTKPIDERFCKYIRSRFGGIRPEDVPYWLTTGRVKHAVCSVRSGWVSCLCGLMAPGQVERLARNTPRTRHMCRKCREKLPEAQLVVVPDLGPDPQPALQPALQPTVHTAKENQG